MSKCILSIGTYFLLMLMFTAISCENPSGPSNGAAGSGSTINLPPYEIVPTQSKRHEPYSFDSLGLGYDSSRQTFRNPAVLPVETKLMMGQQWSSVIGDRLVNTRDELFQALTFRQSLVDQGYYLSDEIRKYAQSIPFDELHLTFVSQVLGIDDHAYLNELEPRVDALDFLQVFGRDAFVQEYGSSFSSSVLSGFAFVLVETYEISPDILPAEAVVIREAILRSRSAETDDSERTALTALFERSGVRKYTHFFTTSAESPNESISSLDDLFEWIESLRVGQWFPKEFFSTIGHQVSEYLPPL